MLNGRGGTPERSGPWKCDRFFAIRLFNPEHLHPLQTRNVLLITPRQNRGQMVVDIYAS